jgi:hypothetical protein
MLRHLKIAFGMCWTLKDSENWSRFPDGIFGLLGRFDPMEGNALDWKLHV